MEMAQRPVNSTESISRAIKSEPADSTDSDNTSDHETCKESFKVKSEYLKKLKEEKLEEFIKTEPNCGQNLIRPCFVSVHRFKNLQDLSACSRCKKVSLATDTFENENGLFNKNLSKGESSIENDVPKMENDEKNRNPPLEPIQIFNPNTSGTRIIKCMFRKNSRTKRSNLKNSELGSKVQSVKRTYKCEACGKELKSKKTLNVHLQLHLEEKRYKCQECGKALTTKTNLKIHLRVHSGEKPYKCEECKKTFTQIGSLKRHLRIHSGQKPFKCQECERTFGRKDHLKAHLQIHS